MTTLLYALVIAVSSFYAGFNLSEYLNSKLAKKLEIAKSNLLAMKLHTTHPDNKPSMWNDYLQDMIDKALADIEKVGE